MDHDRNITKTDPYRYNRQEAEFWQSIKETPIAFFFFEVFDYAPSNGLLLMERALKTPSDYRDMERAKGYDVMMELCNIVNLYDNGVGNCGFKPDGKIALLDYGFQGIPTRDQLGRMVKVVQDAGYER